jgi:tetratricopeptide (TPR) repeat protein
MLEALEIWKRAFGPDHPNALAAMANLGAVYEHQGRYPDAERIEREALEIQKRVLGPEHLDTLKNMDSPGGVYLSEGRQAEAQRLYLEGFREREAGPRAGTSGDPQYRSTTSLHRRGAWKA